MSPPPKGIVIILKYPSQLQLMPQVIPRSPTSPPCQAFDLHGFFCQQTNTIGARNELSLCLGSSTSWSSHGRFSRDGESSDGSTAFPSRFSSTRLASSIPESPGAQGTRYWPSRSPGALRSPHSPRRFQSHRALKERTINPNIRHMHCRALSTCANPLWPRVQTSAGLIPKAFRCASRQASRACSLPDGEYLIILPLYAVQDLRALADSNCGGLSNGCHVGPVGMVHISYWGASVILSIISLHAVQDSRAPADSDRRDCRTRIMSGQSALIIGGMVHILSGCERVYHQVSMSKSSVSERLT
ncbi:hypothetical protein BD779DRAFT_1539574 [Infundibulicybe gibba]|nr:hypothetical protein BD779DRAFT_1539574 [Infundibulicybe gibba]